MCFSVMLEKTEYPRDFMRKKSKLHISNSLSLMTRHRILPIATLRIAKQWIFPLRSLALTELIELLMMIEFFTCVQK